MEDEVRAILFSLVSAKTWASTSQGGDHPPYMEEERVWAEQKADGAVELGARVVVRAQRGHGLGDCALQRGDVGRGGGAEGEVAGRFLGSCGGEGGWRGRHGGELG